MDDTAEQSNSNNPRDCEHLKPWQFKKGQSGNPLGKKKGTVSLKKFAQKYIQSLTEEEKLEYMEGMDKKAIWEMAEGKPKQDTEVSGELNVQPLLVKIIGDEQSNGDTDGV